MPELSDFPYLEAQFDREGRLNPPGQDTAVLDGIGSVRATDLVVLAHGWNNDMAEARDLYAALLARVRAVLPQAPLSAGRRLCVLGLLWPSKKFTDRELISGGGAASVGDGGFDEAGDVSTAHLEGEIDRLKAVARPDAPDLEQAKSLLDQLEDDPDARARFVALVRGSLDLPEPNAGDPRYEPTADALSQDPEQLFQELRAPVRNRPAPSDMGGAAAIGEMSPAGGAAGIGTAFASAKAAAERLLNFATYYQMKERAGRVGGAGVADLLRAVRQRFPDCKVHLVGHSFGARLVSAAADACGDEVKPSSMLLLQAAFSHNGFAPSFRAGNEQYVGFFRRVVEDRKVAGPIVVTHTVNDRAVGLAYAIASRLARQAASDLGDADDLYGGLGRNGALRLPAGELGGASLELLAPGGQYNFVAGKVFNLRADRFIDGHSSISNDAVAYALLRSLAAAR